MSTFEKFLRLLDLDHFDLRPEAFDHQGRLHGVQHVYRVMAHCLALGHRTGARRTALLSLCAAHCHDLARTHDGPCADHGPHAVQRRGVILPSRCWRSRKRTALY